MNCVCPCIGCQIESHTNISDYYTLTYLCHKRLSHKHSAFNYEEKEHRQSRHRANKMIAVSTACLILQSLCVRWIASAGAHTKAVFSHPKTESWYLWWVLCKISTSTLLVFICESPGLDLITIWRVPTCTYIHKIHANLSLSLVKILASWKELYSVRRLYIYYWTLNDAASLLFSSWNLQAVLNFVLYKFGHLPQREWQIMHDLAKMFLHCLNHWKLETPTVKKQHSQGEDLTAYKTNYTRWVHTGIPESPSSYVLGDNF